MGRGQASERPMSLRNADGVVSFYDTSTLPTKAMLDAMVSAQLGDDVYHEDPTVVELEQRAAALMGKEDAIFMPSGTMANLVAIMAHCEPGDEVIVEADSHVFYYESGGLSAVAGTVPLPIAAERGVLTRELVEPRLRPNDVHYPRTRLVCTENTHNRAGGTIVDVATMERLHALCEERVLAIHIDGARIFNAAVALGVPVRQLARYGNSVTFCLSKGLGAPAGSMLSGSSEFVAAARRHRKMLGGAMRQAGVLAAAGLVALDSGIDRLAEDHRRAKVLAHRLAELGDVSVDPDAIETNIVVAHVDPARLPASRLVAELRAAGIKAADRPPDAVRFVTHGQIGDDDVDYLVETMRLILART